MRPVPENLEIRLILFENNFGGATGWSIFDDIQIGNGLTPNVRSWYEGASDLGNGWLWLDWFGSFNVEQAPWIFHAQHGWLYPFGTDPESMYFWDGAMNSIFWTSDTVYPSIYRFSDGRWLFYDKGTSNPRWFVDLLTEIWEQW